MPSSEQVHAAKRQAQKETAAKAQLDEDVAAASRRREAAKEVLDITDELLDEIDAVLLETAEIDFVQKGGQ